MAEIRIINEPEMAANYEFVVVKEDDDGNLLYDSHYADGFCAEKRCLEIGGVIVHNVRIQGVRKRKEG